MLEALMRVAPGAVLKMQKSSIRTGYQLVNRWSNRLDVTFMNYGYAPLAGPSDVSNAQGTSTCSLEMYRVTLGTYQLTGKDVLEVGCGRGGGAAFVMQRFKPRSLVGLDFARTAIQFCRNTYVISGLSFVDGDAEHLPLPSQAFDMVLNVESSHGYPRFEQFLREARRVLRPGGRLLFADFRPVQQVPLLVEQFRKCGFVVLDAQELTPHVLRAIELESELKMSLIRDLRFGLNVPVLPRLLKSQLTEFAGVKGSRAYEQFRTGEVEYMRFDLGREAA